MQWSQGKYSKTGHEQRDGRLHLWFSVQKHYLRIYFILLYCILFFWSHSSSRHTVLVEYDSVETKAWEAGAPDVSSNMVARWALKPANRVPKDPVGRSISHD
jgi:hypothetical protein